MALSQTSLLPALFVQGDDRFEALDAAIMKPVESVPPRRWWITFLCSGSLAGVFLFCFVYTIFSGIGTWGLNRPMGWGFDITNFVFWIGIGHAGTLISAGD
ncbi:MAG: hypothetical protein NTX50_06765 [Candidatus Sumerlaeota bacterium]|nr:hypothetical protein [Candidatus Sumerlaeota bacterium]